MKKIGQLKLKDHLTLFLMDDENKVYLYENNKMTHATIDDVSVLISWINCPWDSTTTNINKRYDDELNEYIYECDVSCRDISLASYYGYGKTEEDATKYAESILYFIKYVCEKHISI